MSAESVPAAVTSRRPDAPGVPDAPGANAGPVAVVEDLRVTFRRGGRAIHAVRGLSLEVRAGEILGLVGESGSGKSVLGLSLLGLLAAGPHVGGRALVHGTDMLGAPEQVRRAVRRDQLGAVFQDPMTSLNPTMRVGRQVAEAAGSGAEALRLLEAVGVPEPARRMQAFPHELSGGLRQRVMIAMAIAGGPSLVVADEPTTALDVTVQAQVLALIRRLRDEIGCAFVLITHDLGVAAQVADRVAVMYAGRLAELGPTATVLTSSAHPYARGLMASRLSLGTDAGRPLASLAGEVPDPARPEPGCAFAPRCALAGPECTTAPPDPVEVAPGHLSACIRPASAVTVPAVTVPAVSMPAVTVPAVTVPADPPPPPADPAPPPAAYGGRVGSPDPVEGLLAEPAAVTATDLVKTYPLGGAGWRRLSRLQALRGVDLTVVRGESVAVVGESGSGKSTLLRVLAGLERADAGSVVHGSAAGAQMVFQDAGASLTPWLSVGELIGERLRAGGERLPARALRDRVADALALVGLPAEVADARAAELSGGQRQRVALARATAVPPEVLLCDEPTSALDVSLAAQVINLLARLRRELDMAVVFVTHDLSVARIVADRIAVMYLGRIVELGAADDVTHRPRHPYTKALVAAVPDVGVELVAGLGEPASPVSPPPGCAFHPRCPLADDACADPTLDPRPARAPGDSTRLVACIHQEVR